MEFKKVYRVLFAIDYNGKRERTLFYTESQEEAECRYIDCQIKVKRFAHDNGLQFYDNKHSIFFWTTFADGNQRGKPWTGCRAELKVEEFCNADFLDFRNAPLF